MTIIQQKKEREEIDALSPLSCQVLENSVGNMGAFLLHAEEDMN